MTGPLAGLRVVELAGQGAAPMGVMMLARTANLWPAHSIGEHTDVVLTDLGLSPDEVAAAKLAGIAA
jgi:crotonobetainyl-CoA:carnitine CoA-transferase CaiB-like acyl-CoA transferase